MLISLDWLKQYVDIKEDIKEYDFRRESEEIKGDYG